MTVSVPDSQSRRLSHEPALDGIRGIAVLLVLVWHYIGDILLNPVPWIQSGHLGVDLFFVLSGFLITALMLNEHNRDGKISFPGFYRRRVFRLLPALVIFLVVHFIWALLTDIPSKPMSPGTELRNEIASVLSALFFSINLLPLFGDYSATLGIGHLWSLAVEEQFYFIWPLLTVILLSPSRWLYLGGACICALLLALTGHFFTWCEIGEPLRSGVSAVVGIGVFSVLAMSQRWRSGTRALVVLPVLILAVLMFRRGFYDGSLGSMLGLYGLLPARADSVIIGAMLAYLWVNGRIPYRCPTALSVIAWIAFGWMVSAFTLHEPFFYMGGWTLVAVCGAFIIWGSLGSQGTLYGRVLMWPWLRAIGKVAYGLYLWHAFVFAAVRHSFADESLLVRTVLALGITAVVTTASWFWVERPMLAYKSPRRRKAVSSGSTE